MARKELGKSQMSLLEFLQPLLKLILHQLPEQYLMFTKAMAQLQKQARLFRMIKLLLQPPMKWQLEYT